jgi:hypothetical protein
MMVHNSNPSLPIRGKLMTRKQKKPEGPYEIEEFIELLDNIDSYCECEAEHIDFCICKNGEFDDEE